MDIFTTVLTRVVPVPIKPANLKVKALLKEAGASKLKEDLDHLENHDYYFSDDKKKQKGSEQDKSSAGEQAEAANVESTNVEPENTTVESTDKHHADNTSEGVTESKDGVKHLDLYV